VAGGDVLLEFTRVAKQAGGPRPLRVAHLALRRAERIALTGLDVASAEILVGLITGAAVPDAGEVRLFGRSTADIRDATEWFAALDRVGLVSPRAVWVPQSTVLQNLAVPYTLSIDPLAPEVARRVEHLAGEAGIPPAWLSALIEAVPPEVEVRVRLARALALEPELLVVEQAGAGLSSAEVRRFARDLARLSRARHLAVLALTSDDRLAWELGGRVVALERDSGAARERRPWWRRLRAHLGLA
jgi:predicted ABC-type transport system involved in lysophospholipase L1 biosynthesis ATPase subunit